MTRNKNSDDNEQGYDGISAVLQTKLAASSSSKAKSSAPTINAEEEEEAAPALINPDWPHLKAVLDAADAVVEVLDARDPAACRVRDVEEYVRGKEKRVVLVLNKIGAPLLPT